MPDVLDELRLEQTRRLVAEHRMTPEKRDEMMRRAYERDAAIGRIASAIPGAVSGPSVAQAAYSIADEMLAYAGSRLRRAEEQCAQCVRLAPTHTTTRGRTRRYHLPSAPLTGLERHLLRHEKIRIFLDLARADFPFPDEQLDVIHLEMWRRAFEEAA